MNKTHAYCIHKNPRGLEQTLENIEYSEEVLIGLLS